MFGLDLLSGVLNAVVGLVVNLTGHLAAGINLGAGASS